MSEENDGTRNTGEDDSGSHDETSNAPNPINIGGRETDARISEGNGIIGAQPLTFDTQQQQAIELCQSMSLVNRIVAVTGAAGTGKTTIIRETAERLSTVGHQVAIAAPTGKAARRISEATGLQATTIHRLLEFPKPYEYDERTGQPLNAGLPRRNKDNRLDYDVVIVDEYAMVNQDINRMLVDALKPGAMLRCFGDNNQLQPIEERNFATAKHQQSPFQYYLKTFPSITLEHVYRQAEGSGILENATRIAKGFMPKPAGDFVIGFTDRPTAAIENFMHAHKETFSTFKNQVIVLSNKGWVGTYELNQRLQQILNPSPTSSFDPPRHKWQAEKEITIGVGDKVVCTENMYDLRDHYERFAVYRDDGSPKQDTYIDCPAEFTILNGETGRVLEIIRDPNGYVEHVAIDVGDRIVRVPFSIHEWSPKKSSIYPVSPIMGIDLGYALTTHKCQGSEYDEIVYVLNKSTRFMQNRRNFYTAVTRARKKVTLITDRVSLQSSLTKKEN